jgi:hypothetical protein
MADAVWGRPLPEPVVRVVTAASDRAPLELAEFRLPKGKCYAHPVVPG